MNLVIIFNLPINSNHQAPPCQHNW